MSAFSIQEAQDLVSFAGQTTARLALAPARLDATDDEVLAEQSWLEIALQRVEQRLLDVQTALREAQLLPEFAGARKVKAETLSSAWADAIETVFDAIVANVSANGPLIEALFPHQRFGTLRRPGTAAHSFWLEFERRADSGYVKRLCTDPAYAFLAPLLDAAKASERQLREAASPRPLPEAQADALRAKVSEAAANLELAVRQARSLCEAAFARTPEVVRELGLDAKLKRRAPRPEPAKVQAD
jgi:hypothetical protein